MNPKAVWSALTVVLSLSSGLSQAEQMVNAQLVSQTENGAFLPDGRYFVAGSSGIQEVKSSADDHHNCAMDPTSRLTVCTQVTPDLDGHRCFYSSLTSDGTYLYASCTDWKEGLLGTFQKPNYASLLRILPGESIADEVIVREFPQPVWYNGMDMLDDRVIVAEAGLVSGAIVAVHKCKAVSPSRINTGLVQLSDLDLDPGTFSQGALIATSYYKGGLYRFPLPK